MPQPNILLFLTDDHAPWSLAAYGNTRFGTPNFSRLAAAGTTFLNAFTPSPVCSPARACLMTGRTPSQVGVHDWLEEFDPEIGSRDWLAEEKPLPQLLRETGYHTILSGKWHMGSAHSTPPGFDRHFRLPGWQGGHNGTFTYSQDGEPVTLDGNKSGRITERALQMLSEAPAGRPFFLNVGYIATHSPYEAECHDPAIVREVESLDFEDFLAFEPHPWAKNEGISVEGAANREALVSRYRGYHAAVLEVDRNLGRIWDELEARGQLANTIVIYVSDHGCALGHQGFWGKGNSTRPLNMYDVSLRVPYLMQGPGIAAGQRVEAPVDHYDLFQAICEWGGVKREGRDWYSRRYPGRSLASLAAGEEPRGWQQERYGEYGDLRCIHTPEWKYVERYPEGPHDLFHNGDEETNLAEEPEFELVREDLSRQLRSWYAIHEEPEKSGLRVKELARHNNWNEAWRDGIRESRGLQVY